MDLLKNGGYWLSTRDVKPFDAATMACGFGIQCITSKGIHDYNMYSGRSNNVSSNAGTGNGLRPFVSIPTNNCEFRINETTPDTFDILIK